MVLKPVVAAASVVLAVAALGAGLAYWFTMMGDGGESDADWWEPLLGFAPPEAAGGHIILSNAERLFTKEGLPAPGNPCGSESGVVPGTRARAEHSSTYFYGLLYSPDIGIGFDACQVLRYAQLSYGPHDTTIRVFEPNVAESAIRAALEESAYEVDESSDHELYVLQQRSSFEDLPAGGLFDSYAFPALADGYVVTSNDRAAILSALAAPRGEIDMPRGLMAAVEPFDAAWIYSDDFSPRVTSFRDIVVRICGLQCTNQQTQRIEEEIRKPLVTWSELPKAERIAITYLADTHEGGSMNIGLLYATGDGEAARSELQERLDTFESFSRAEQLCDTAEANATTSAPMTIIVGTCTGEETTAWRDLLLGPDAILLWYSVERAEQ